MVSKQAIFAGGSTLLIHCAQAYRAAGHHILGVITSDLKIIEWASENGICLISEDDKTWPDASFKFDFLFSINPPRSLHPALIAQARVQALGFLESPWPDFPDPYGPSRALITQKTQYGVCWRDLNQFARGQAAVKHVSFGITDGETAWSLQAKCYEAGLSSFVSMVEDMGQGEFHASKAPVFEIRPNRSPLLHALGTLDFSQPAKALVSLVSGLDFGHEPNLIGLAKIYLGHTFAVVRKARFTGGSSLQLPGTVLHAEGDQLAVATFEGEILFSGCSDLAGRPLEDVFTTGLLLQSPAEELCLQLNERVFDLAQGEHYWSATYRHVSPVEFPYPRKPVQSHSALKNSVRVALTSTCTASELAAAFCTWLSVLTAQQQVSILYCDATLVGQAAPLECWLSAWVPLTLSTLMDTTTQQATAQTATQIDDIRKAGPYIRDLPLRIGLAADISNRLAKVGVCMANRELPDGMDLMLASDPTSLGLTLVADDRIYSDDVLKMIGAQFAAYLERFSAGGFISALRLTTDEEMAVFDAVNNTFLPYQIDLSVEELITAQARRTPHQEAVRFGGSKLSYGELEAQATALTARLRARGVGPGHIIGLCLGRGIDLVVCLLGIAKTGAAHLPLDPDYPRDRLFFMMEDSQTAFILTTKALAVSLDLPLEKTFLFDGPDDVEASCLKPIVAPLLSLSARMAYLMYTSGSTGKPKGVMVTQQNLLNLFTELDAMMAPDPAGRWLAIGSVCFDISVPELWWTLTRGFTVVIHQRTDHQWSVAQALLENEITHFFCTPSMASMLVADAAGRAALARLSVLMVGGEALQLQLVNELCEIVSGRVFNIYGPTETTVFATACELSTSMDFVPLGGPIANTTLSVRTASGAQCPVWIPGELLIGGDGVSSGYWRRAELTDERFVTDPSSPGGRTLYKTGDLVRRHLNGALEFLGRIDHQVKIRGHRIELGEIENVILQLSDVYETVVIAEKDKFGDPRLIAYVVPKVGKTLSAEQIQTAIASKLPAIMIPGIVMVVRAFALTPNGKVDRRALPAPKPALSKTNEASMPRTSLELSIVKIWEQVLGVGPINTTENFFELGGNFYLGIKAQVLLVEASSHFAPLADIVRFPTARGLAQHLDLHSKNIHGQVHLDKAQAGSQTESNLLDLANSPVPELTAVESMVAGIWRDLFEIEPISKDADFFKLGGNSLAAIRMFAQLRKQLPVELPLSSLFEASSLAGFCELIEKSQKHEHFGKEALSQAAPSVENPSAKRPWSPIVQICRGDEQRLPLFCVHGAGGNVFNFKAISQKLGADQPVYGLHPQGVDGHRPVLDSFEAMAEQYVTAIQTVDSHGPYQLLGYSAGGVIAFEMARQLRKTGHKVALLAMIDTLTPRAATSKPTPLKKLWLIRKWTFENAMQKFKERHRKSALETGHAEALEKLTRGEWLTPELVEPYLFSHIVEVQGRYKPAPYDGALVLYKALDATITYLNAGEYLGWEAHVNGFIKVVDVTGSHNSMMEEPGLTELSLALKAELDRLHVEAKRDGLSAQAHSIFEVY